MLFVILCLALQNFSVCCMTYYSAKTQKDPLSKFLQVFSSDSSLFSNMFPMAGGKPKKHSMLIFAPNITWSYLTSSKSQPYQQIANNILQGSMEIKITENNKCALNAGW